MKINFKSYLFLLFAGLIGMSSCKDDEEEKPLPTLTIVSSTISTGTNPTGGTAMPGTAVILTLKANATEKIQEIRADVKIGTAGGGTLSGYPKTSFDTPTSHEWTETYTVPQNGPVVIRFTVKDKNGKEAFKEFTITVEPDFSTWSAKLLSLPLLDQSSKTFFISSTGGTHTLAEAAANSSLVDFGYFQGPTGMATLAAPSDYLTAPQGYNLDWTTKNPTEFKRTTNVNFSNIASASDIGTAYDAGTLATNGSNPDGGPSRVNMLQVNDVVGFKTVAGKKGLLKVTAVVIDQNFGSAGSITFDVKVQK